MRLNKENVKYIIKLSVILLAITFVCTAVLALVNSFTQDVITKNKVASQEKARVEVLQSADKFEKADTGALALVELAVPVTDIYEGIKDNKTVGYTVGVTPNGYGGAIELVVGIDTDYTVTGITIISMSETPGLGAKIKDNSFKDGIKGKNAKDGLTVNKNGNASDNEINAISGATISSRAVCDGINTAVGAVKYLTEGSGSN